MHLLDPSLDTTRTGLRGIPHGVQEDEVKKGGATPSQCFCEEEKETLFGGGGSSQLFAYFCFSRAVLQPNPHEKRRMCVEWKRNLMAHGDAREEK